MADLAAAYRGAGYQDVSTFLASGNVVLSSDEPPDPSALSQVVSDAFGFESEAFVRSASALRSIIVRNPWPDPGALVEVSLLEREPEPQAAQALATLVKPPEGLVISGAEVFYLRERKGIETVHKEATTARMLGQITTRRGLRTVRDIEARFFVGSTPEGG